MPLIDDAIILAAEVHAGQRRKHPIEGVSPPYIVHPLAVLEQLWLWGVTNDNTRIAAVLHDSLEDYLPNFTKPDLIKRIRKDFGEHVLDVITHLTWNPEETKSQYLEGFRFPSMTCVEALVIKVADRLCNVRDFFFSSLDYAPKYFRKANALEQALEERKNEIIKEFGEKVYAEIMVDWKNITLSVEVAEFIEKEAVLERLNREK